MSTQLIRDDFRARYPELFNFLGGWFPDADLDELTDDEVARQFASRDAARSIDAVITEARDLLTQSSFPADAVGDIANRYFESVDEAREWLAKILAVVEATRNCKR